MRFQNIIETSCINITKPKMWNISKTTERRAKWAIIWDSGYYCSAHLDGTFHFIPDSLSLVGVIQWTLQNLYIFFSSLKTAVLPIFIRFFHPNFIQGILIMGQYRLLLFLRSPPNYKKYGILTFFLSICSWKFQSAISPTIFIGAHPNFMRTLVTMVNLNACSNTAIRNYHLVPKVA